MEFKEISVPQDAGISSLHFSPFSDDILCTTTWSGELNVYSADSLSQIQTYHFDSPLISSCWINEQQLAAGSINGKVYFSHGKTLENHSQGVSQVGFFPQLNLFFSTSWDGSIQVYDLQDYSLKHSFYLEQKILTACHSSTAIVACTNKNMVYIIDLLSPYHIEYRVSSLQMQIRSICISRPEEYGWAVSSIDGRVAIEYFGDLRSQAQRFAFHSHRKEEEDGKIIVYPINSMAFHPTEEGLLATACSGGYINFWDILKKIKLNPIPFTCETSISAIDFSNDGTSLAIASSYMWDKGEIEHPPDRLLIVPIDIESIRTNKQ